MIIICRKLETHKRNDGYFSCERSSGPPEATAVSRSTTTTEMVHILTLQDVNSESLSTLNSDPKESLLMSFWGRFFGEPSHAIDGYFTQLNTQMSQKTVGE